MSFRLVRDIAEDVDAIGGRALIVGGSVRDRLRNGGWSNDTDWDLEVFGLSGEQLKDVLSKHGHIDLVGEAFGVIKMHGLNIDVSLPRRDSKRGFGHRGFDVESDPHMTVEDAARRRDFTINAMSFDPLLNDLIDPFNGRADLNAGLLRMVDPATFGDDPLRVLRGMQFCARFGLTAHRDTIQECVELFDEGMGLSVERVWEEWRKMIVQGTVISKGFKFLRESGWIMHYPELMALVGCNQDPEWHPEGDVWTHTGFCLDAFADLPLDGDDKLIVGFSVLCHDLGKPSTTQFMDGRWRAHGHEGAGTDPARSFLKRIGFPQRLRGSVYPLIENHLAPVVFYKDQVSNRAMLRLANRVGRMDLLTDVCFCDQAGRPPAPVNADALNWFTQRAQSLHIADKKPVPIVQGRDLIDSLGMTPSAIFGPILAACMEAQLDGSITTLDEGLTFAQEWRAA